MLNIEEMDYGILKDQLNIELYLFIINGLKELLINDKSQMIQIIKFLKNIDFVSSQNDRHQVARISTLMLSFLNYLLNVDPTYEHEFGSALFFNLVKNLINYLGSQTNIAVFYDEPQAICKEYVL